MPSKLSRPLIQALSASKYQGTIPIIVKYHEGIVTAKAFIEGTRPKYHFNLFRGAAWDARPEQIAGLVQAAEVKKIYLDLPVHAYLDVAVPHVGAPRAWSKGYTGRGIKICLVDTGIDPRHPDFTGRIVAGINVRGGSYADDNGHGTHVAGAAAGSGTASGGKYRGVAPEASLYIAKALDSDGAGMMSDVMAGIEWAVSQRVQVICLSLGNDGPGDGTDALSETCDLAVRLGIVVCAAAGNSGPMASSVGSPGCARQVITVGACSDDDQVMDFSARGPTQDGRTKPDILFPGDGIVSCRAHGTSLGQPIDQHYTELSGTSMATPQAAGAAALILQAHPGLKPEQVKEILKATAVNLGLDPNTQGSGRADVARAVLASGAPEGNYPRPSPTPDPGLPNPQPPTESPAPKESPQRMGCSKIMSSILKRTPNSPEVR